MSDTELTMSMCASSADYWRQTAERMRRDWAESVALCAEQAREVERLTMLLRTPEPERTMLAYQHLRERMEKEPKLGFDLMVRAGIINEAGQLRERFGGEAE